LDWNPPKFKILGVWLTADLTDCEEYSYNNKFSEMKILFNIWIKRTITPSGRIAILKSLILSKIVQLWILLPNPPDGFIDRLQNKNKNKFFKLVWNRKQEKISRKTVIKNVRKGGLGLLDIRQFIIGLKLIWIRKLLNDSHKWKNNISIMFPIIRTLGVNGPCLLLKNGKLVLEEYSTGL